MAVSYLSGNVTKANNRNGLYVNESGSNLSFTYDPNRQYTKGTTVPDGATDHTNSSTNKK